MIDAELAALEAAYDCRRTDCAGGNCGCRTMQRVSSPIMRIPDRTGHIPSQKVTSSSPSEHTVLNRHTVMACRPSGSPAKSSGKPPGAMAGAGCVPCDNFTEHAKRKCRSRRADARRRIKFGNLLDLDLAARTGDGNKASRRGYDQFALCIARGLEECVQACRASRACWPGRTRRALGRRRRLHRQDHVDQVDQAGPDRPGGPVRRLDPLDPLDRVVRLDLVVPAGLQSNRPARSRAQVQQRRKINRLRRNLGDDD